MDRKISQVESYYRENSDSYSQRTGSLKKRIHIYGSIRLALAVVWLVLFWIFRAEGWQVLTILTVIAGIPFTILMVCHNKLDRQRNYYGKLAGLNENELKALNYDFSAFDGARDKISPSHYFSLDLDIFGDNSLFQSVNRTVTAQGRELLASWFTAPLTSKQGILCRQDSVRELSGHSQLRQHFHVTGEGKGSNNRDAETLQSLTRESSFFYGNKLYGVLLILIPSLWAILLAGCTLGIFSWQAAGVYFIFCFLIAYAGGIKVDKVYKSVGKMEKIFSTYSSLMRSIERQSFESDELKQIVARLSGSGGNITASSTIKQLSGYIGGLDQRGSMAGILLNILYLRDTRYALLLEKWKVKNKNNIILWLDALAKFDAYCSLATFAFNHPDYTYADIADNYFRIEGKGLGHPLISREVCVRNDIKIEKNPWFIIITGANMAGKSTWLRTVGVNHLLSCIGVPACAENLTVYPAKLVTSLRTSDSLAGNESYFFAELKRLKMIIDLLKNGEELFIILDEILKGTNSVDKQKGSFALIKQLLSLNACGIIATHDLLLGELEREYPGQIRNYRFEADINNDEITFSYRLREGIACNMNATFLMKKMGIIV